MISSSIIIASLLCVAYGQIEMSAVIISATEVRSPLFTSLVGNLTIRTIQNSSSIILSANGQSDNYAESISIEAHGVEVGRFTDNQFAGPTFYTNYIAPLPGKTDIHLNAAAGSTHFVGNVDMGGAAVTGGFHLDSSFRISPPTLFGSLSFFAPAVGGITIDASASTGTLKVSIPELPSSDTFVFNDLPANLSQKNLIAPTADSLNPPEGVSAILMGSVKMQGDIDMNGFCIYNTACLNLSRTIDIHRTTWSGIWDEPQKGDIKVDTSLTTVTLFVPGVIAPLASGSRFPGDIPSIDTFLPEELAPSAYTSLIIRVINDGYDAFGVAVIDIDGSLKIGYGPGLNPPHGNHNKYAGWHKFTIVYDIK